MATNHALNQTQILVVDDEPDLRTLYELTLLREGFRVEAAGSVKEAWQLLEERGFDVVITDMRLPDGLGLELLRGMLERQRPERCIVMTAYGSAENAVEALKAGAFDYLTKPVDLKLFRAVVASAIQECGPAARAKAPRAANAAGNAVAASGVSILSFSNNPAIAGGNVFVLGTTFPNISNRLSRYAVRQGKGNVMILHDRTPAGDAGRAAIEASVAAASGSVVGVMGYEFSQNGIVQAAPAIAAAARSNGANALFLTADTAGSLPLLTQLLRDNGLSPAVTQFVGLTRWDIPPAALALPGVQGGWFALPDPALYEQYVQRYSAAYGTAPHPVSGLAYDGIAAIGALAGRGGGLSTAELTQGSGFAGVTGVFRLLPDGSNERGLAVAEIRNNQVVVIDPAPRSFGGAGF